MGGRGPPRWPPTGRCTATRTQASAIGPEPVNSPGGPHRLARRVRRPRPGRRRRPRRTPRRPAAQPARQLRGAKPHGRRGTSATSSPGPPRRRRQGRQRRRTRGRRRRRPHGTAATRKQRHRMTAHAASTRAGTRPSTGTLRAKFAETMEARDAWEQHTREGTALAVAAHSEYMRRHPDAELPPMRSAEPPQAGRGGTRRSSGRTGAEHEAPAWLTELEEQNPRRPGEDRGNPGPPRTQRRPRVGRRRRSMARRAAPRT